MLTLKFTLVIFLNVINIFLEPIDPNSAPKNPFYEDASERCFIPDGSLCHTYEPQLNGMMTWLSRNTTSSRPSKTSNFSLAFPIPFPYSTSSPFWNI